MKTPKDLRYITMQYMKDYVIEKGPEDITWLIDILESKLNAEDDAGSRVHSKRAFADVRTAFADRYFPELAPKSANQRPNIMRDALQDLYSARDQKRG